MGSRLSWWPGALPTETRLRILTFPGLLLWITLHGDSILSGRVMTQTTVDTGWISQRFSLYKSVFFPYFYLQLNGLHQFVRKSVDHWFHLCFQAKEEFGSTADIVQTIQTMTANLVKVTLSFTCMWTHTHTLIQYDPS